jgi:hypothetical protein
VVTLRGLPRSLQYLALVSMEKLAPQLVAAQFPDYEVMSSEVDPGDVRIPMTWSCIQTPLMVRTR